MLSELLQKLETQHSIPPSQASGILNTITQHIKEKFPAIGGMLDKVLGSQAASPGSTLPQNPVHENALQQLEDLAKNKLGSLFGG